MKSPLTGLLLLALAGFAPAAPAPLVEGRFSPGIWNIISDNDLNPNQDVTRFGSVNLVTSSDRRFRLGNPGTGVLLWEGASSSDGQFRILNSSGATQAFPIPIVAGDEREFLVRFTPTTLFVSTTTISLDTNAASLGAVYTFALEGTGVGPEIQMSGRSNLSDNWNDISDGETTVRTTQGTDFGNFPLAGGFTTNYFRIFNEGNTNLNLSNARITGSGQSHFSIRSLSTLTAVTAFSSREFEIRFVPTTAGTKTATFQIDTNDPNENPYSFTLRGTATTFPEIQFEGRRDGGTGQTFSNLADGDTSPSAGDGTEFWTTAVGASSNSRFRISNTGNAPLSLATPTLSGAQAGEFSILPLVTTDLPAGQSREFFIRFTPTSPGIKSATFSMANGDATENPFNFTIRGSSFITPVPEIRVSGRSNLSDPYVDIENDETIVTVAQGTDFGNFPLAGGFSSRFFQITNDGNEKLTFNQPGLEDLGAPQFSIDGPNGDAINPGESLEFEIRFDPQSPGTHKATFVLANSDPDEARFSFAIQGIATTFPEIQLQGRRTGGVGQTLSNITDNSVAVFASNGTSFPDTNWGESSDNLFRISNTSGNTPLTLEMPTITGPDADQFHLLPLLTDDLAPGGSRDFFIRFTPTSRGTKTATFSMENNDNNENPFSFVIAGTGTRGPELVVCGRAVTNDQIVFYSQIPIEPGDLNPNQDVTNVGSVRVSESDFRYYCVQNRGTADFVAYSMTSSNPDFTLVFPDSVSFPILGDDWPSLGFGSAEVPNIFQIHFTPTSYGEQTSIITLLTNDPENPTYTFAVRGTGIGPNMTVSGAFTTEIANGETATSAANGTFLGEAALSGETQVRAFRIRNEGTTRLQFLSASITGTHAADFTIGGLPESPFNLSIQPGDFRDFLVEFDPSANGVRNATVRLTSDDALKNPYTFAIAGTGAVNPRSPSIEIKGGRNPSLLTVIPNGSSRPESGNQTDFGSTDVGGNALTRQFTIFNTSNQPLTIFAVFVNHPSFDTPLLANTTIDPFLSRTFSVVFTPTSGGVADAIVTVLNDDPANSSYTFAITAEALGATTGPTVGGITINGTTGGGEITIEGRPGQSYRLVSSTTLLPGSWAPVTGYENVTATGSPQILSLLGLFDLEEDPTLFFRVEEN